MNHEHKSMKLINMYALFVTNVYNKLNAGKPFNVLRLNVCATVVAPSQDKLTRVHNTSVNINI